MTARITADIKRILRSTKGHNVLLYLLFACVAFVFWLILSLDTEVQRDYEIPVLVSDVPDSVVFLGNAPARITVSVQGRGSQLLPFSWGNVPVIKLKFSEFSASRGRFYVSHSRLETRVRDYFGSGVQVNAVRPDSVLIRYTLSRGKRLPLMVDCKVSASLQSVINGPIRASVDSVSVYSDKKLPKGLKYVQTEFFEKTDLRDSTVIEVQLKKIPGVRIIPDKVRVSIPVEPLIAKHRQIGIDIVNVPANVGFLTFPSTVEVSYLVPMSKFSTEDFPFKAFVDYNSINEGDDKLRINMVPAPDYYHNVTLSTDSVEYVLERK